MTPVPQQELLDAYAGWSEDALKMLRCIEKPSKWSIFALDPPLESFVKGRVALVGDAVSSAYSLDMVVALPGNYILADW